MAIKPVMKRTKKYAVNISYYLDGFSLLTSNIFSLLWIYIIEPSLIIMFPSRTTIGGAFMHWIWHLNNTRLKKSFWYIKYYCWVLILGSFILEDNKYTFWMLILMINIIFFLEFGYIVSDLRTRTPK